jgi:hypothetical protein
MTEYSRIAKGNLTAASGQATAVVQLPFQPDYVEIWNYTNIKTAAANTVTRAWWDNKLVDGANNPTMVEIYNNSSATVFDTIQTNGISSYAAGLMLQYGATQQVVGITKASQAVVTVTGHGYNVGDTVTFQGIATGVTNNAMRLLNNVPFTITAVTTNTFTINWNTNQSNYTAISASPAGALVKKVLYPFLYLPQDNVISAVTTGTSTTVATTMYHNFTLGQQVAFRVPSFWGMTQLNSLPNNPIPGQPIYGYVTSITDNWTFVCSINSTGFTAFTTNQSSIPTNVTYAQALAVGDVNTGGESISAGSNLYPSPLFPTSTNRVSTINGPAIKGAFVNNTAQGFIIGAGVTNTDANANSAILTPSQANLILWRAYLSDYSNP